MCVSEAVHVFISTDLFDCASSVSRLRVLLLILRTVDIFLLFSCVMLMIKVYEAQSKNL